jgi:hypothetical protein
VSPLSCLRAALPTGHDLLYMATRGWECPGDMQEAVTREFNDVFVGWTSERHREGSANRDGSPPYTWQLTFGTVFVGPIPDVQDLMRNYFCTDGGCMVENASGLQPERRMNCKDCSILWWLATK